VKARVSLLIAIVAFSVVGLSASRGAAQDSARGTRPQLRSAQLPLRFERNEGQTDAHVRFLSRGHSFTLYLTNDAMVMSFAADGQKASALRIAFAGAKSAADLTGIGEMASRSHYITGRDAHAWRTSVPNYSKVQYQGIYPNIDLVVYGHDRELEYDFIVAPHARPEVIRLAVSGGNVALDDHGDLRITTSSGSVSFSRPHVYQDGDHGRRDIAGEYRAIGTHEIGFAIGSYDTSRPLVIDPVLAYSTYLGGGDWDVANDLKADAAGNAYVCGYTASANFPTTTGQTVSGGGYDAFIAKIRPDGSLEYATYLGGSGFDAADALAVDASGAVYVTGGTNSSDFPVVGALQPSYRGGLGGDAFITKLDPSGSSLVYSTYLGGSGSDGGSAIALDAAGKVYLAGITTSLDFPLVAPLRSQYGGGFFDVFVAKINAAGNVLEYSTYLGGSDSEGALAIALGAAGEIYVGGYTLSSDYPVASAIQPQFHGGVFDGFLTKLSPDGSAMIYSTYLGTSGFDAVGGLKVDVDGTLLVTGYAGFGFPTTPGAYRQTFGGYGHDAFISRLSADGQRFLFSTYFGGNRDDSGRQIDTDPAGHIWVLGNTDSPNLPMVSPVQGTYGGGIGVQDAFVTEFSADGSQLLFSTYLGGSDIDSGLGLGVDGLGNVSVAGQTASTDFPTVAPIQAVYAGPRDAFVARIVMNHAPTANAGPDQNVRGDANCRATVMLDGTRSSDPDGDPLAYAWTGSFGTAAGPTPQVTLGTGTQAITLTVADGDGGISSDAVQVIVTNSVPPSITSLTPTPSALAPPNHQMVSVSVAAEVAPACGTTASCQIAAVSSNEPEDGLGDGDTAPDWIVTGPLTLQLRAERAGSGSGRVYTILVRCTDSAGNSATRSVTVTVR
jgi:PKD domain/Beta-propeller repeat